MEPSTPVRESANNDKPLPAAPTARSMSEAPVTPRKDSVKTSPPNEKRPSIPSALSFQRPKKKLQWRGKTCIVALPLEDGKDEQGQPKQYLKPDEVSKRYREWEASGYDTSGFNLLASDSNDFDQGGRSRTSYPDPTENLTEFRQRQFKVSIPDRMAWENYVRELKEAKLRALGVGAVDEEPTGPTSPQDSSAMSREVSSQNSLTQSGSGAPQSTSSPRSPTDARLSPPIPGAGNSFVRQGSMGSPGGSAVHPMPMDQFLTNDPSIPSAISPLNGNLQQNGGLGPISRGISPLVDGEARRTTRSPVSPMLEPTAPEFVPGQPAHLAQLRQQNAVGEASHALRPEQAHYFNQTHIASPLPQAHHRHNVSESLQREIDEAESHLEATIEKELEEQRTHDTAAGQASENLIDLEENASIGQNGKGVTSDAETNPSLTGSRTTSGQHAPKLSQSQTSAKASSGFVFDPTKNFTPSFGAGNFEAGMFTFGGQQGSAGANSTAPGRHSKTTSNTSAFSSPFNVSAPSFTPGQTFSFQPANTQFSFTSNLPTLKPDAPEFVPGSGLGISANDQKDTDPPPIFQNFNFADIVKQPQKNKAVPIIPPKPSQESDSDVEIVEGEDGRAARSDGRQKRARRGGASGDQVPLFASPTPDPPSMRAASAQEVSSPVVATGHLKDLLDDLPASTASVASSRSRKSSAAGSELETHETSSLKSAGETFSPPNKKQEDNEVDTTPSRQPQNGTRSVLSATAKPFEFNPSAGSFSPTTSAPQSAQQATEETPPPKKPVFSTGLGGSRFAPTGKSRSPSPEKAATAAEKRAMEERILNGVSYVEPSYQEIDEVMQRLNGDDSDAGIERNPAAAWKPPTPPTHQAGSPSRSRSRSRARSQSSASMSDGSTKRRPAERLSTTASPNRLRQPFQYLPERDLGSSSYDAVAEIVAENARYSPSFKESRRSPARLDNTVHHIASKKKRGSVSDWGSGMSSNDEKRIHSRSGFFDARVHDVVGQVMEKRLQPLEDNLATISAGLARLMDRSQSRRLRRSESAEVEDSDADDEDEFTQSRALSPIKDRRFEKLKQALLEAVAVQPTSASKEDIASVKEAFAELRTQLDEKPQLSEPAHPVMPDEIREMQATLAELKGTLAERSAAPEPATPAVPEELREVQATLAELKNTFAEQRAVPESSPHSDELRQLHATLAELKQGLTERSAAAEVQPAVPDEMKEMHAALAEIKSTLAQRQSPTEPPSHSEQLNDLHAALAELKNSMVERSAVPTAAPATDGEMQGVHTALAEIKNHLAERQAAAEMSRSVEFDAVHTTLGELKSALAEQTTASQQRHQGNQPAPVESDQLKEMHTTLVEMRAALAERPPATETDSGALPEELNAMRSALIDMKSAFTQQLERDATTPSAVTNHTELRESIETLKSSLQDHSAVNMSNEIKSLIEESLSRQLRGKSGPVSESHDAAAVEKLQLKVSGLESMLKVAEERAAEEVQSRRAVEDALADSERRLKASSADVSQYRDSAEETEKSLQSFLEAQQTAKQHTATLEEVKSNMERTISDQTDQIVALKETLEEYRQSHEQDKKDLEEQKSQARSLDDENQNLDRTLRSLKAELEDSVRTKQSLKGRFEKVHEEMANTARKVTQEQSSWRHKESEHKARYDLLSARLSAEARTRERLEGEIDRLEKQEKEALKAKYLVEQIRGENKNLVTMVNQLRTKNHELEDGAKTHEREIHHLKESNRSEVGRIMSSTKADVAAANQQVELLRSNLESVIERLETEVAQHKAEGKNQKQRYETLLEEASKSRDVALREAAEARDASLQEHYRFHEHTLEETKAMNGRTIEEIHGSHERAMEELKASHQRTIDTAVEDHDRAMANAVSEHERALKTALDEKKAAEDQLLGRIALADETTAHLREHSAHLEERLEIAKSAAQAAAEAAKAARATPQEPLQKAPASARAGSTRASMPLAEDGELPEKISPQALRESIMVLQEQLHQRESQIENLEEELGKVDKEAPNKVKERDIEISWLRELLGVRLDDLQDIIQQIEQPSFDADSVRNAAIRLKANLQMEQQEKERAMAGGQRFPSLSTLTSTPRAALPMAAAAAWGSWRKGQASLGTLAEMAAPIASSSTNGAGPDTPTKSSAQSFLSGLLTPPSNSMRQVSQPTTPTALRPGSSRRPLSQHGPPRRTVSSPKQEVSTPRRALANVKPPPRTPPPIPLQADEYDGDAQSEHYDLDQYVNESPEDSETPEPEPTPTADEPLIEPEDPPSRTETPPINDQTVELQAEVP